MNYQPIEKGYCFNLILKDRQIDKQFCITGTNQVLLLSCALLAPPLPFFNSIIMNKTQSKKVKMIKDFCKILFV